MKTLKVGERISIKPKAIKETCKATITGFKTLPSGKELIIVVTEKGNKFPITTQEIVKEAISGRIEAVKSEDVNHWGEVEKRYLIFYTTLSSKNSSFEALEDTLYNVAEYMESKLDIEFSYCPYQDDYKNIKSYGDGFYIEYNHGDMMDIKKEVMQAWKEAKKIYNVR